ncbi:MAG: hypothetical protein P8107_05950 [Spirochaetia bacterium]
MKRVDFSKSLRGLLLFILLLAVFSCSEGDFTIFYQVVNEKAIQDNDLENTIGVYGMARADLTGYGGTADRYYIAAGKIFTREVGSNNWDSVSNQTQNDEDLCNGIALRGSTLFAIFFNVDGSSSGLYYRDLDASLAVDPKNITWTRADDALINNKKIGFIKEVNNLLFIALREGNTFSMVYSTIGTAFTQVTFPVVLQTPLSDVSYDSGGTTYYFVSGWAMFAGSANNPGNFNGPPPINGTERYEGVIYTDNGRLYVATSKGHIFLNTGPATWDSVHFNYTHNAIEDDVWFTKFEQVEDSGVPTVDMVVVGSRGAGFYEINENQGVNDIERFANTSKNELYAGSVGSFFMDSSNYDFYVLTLGSGLWRSELKDNNWQSWIWE